MMSILPIAAVSGLADLLERENAALAAMDLPRAAAMLTEKTAGVAALAAAAGERNAAASPPDLVLAARRLNVLALENRRLLERAMEAQERVIGIVARAVASTATRPAYGARGIVEVASEPMALSTRA